MGDIANVQTQDRNINQLQQNIKQAAQPVLNNPIVNGTILSGVTLAAGSNTINHGLGRTLQGWFIVRFQGAFAQIFDTQNSNQSPNKTLVLNSSAKVVVNIYVF